MKKIYVYSIIGVKDNSLQNVYGAFVGNSDAEAKGAAVSAFEAKAPGYAIQMIAVSSLSDKDVAEVRKLFAA